MIFAYPRARYVLAVLAQDLLLSALLLAFAIFRPSGAFAAPLAIAAAAVLAWGIFTLHFPSKVELTDVGVAFFGYGRVHRFRWSSVERVKVRRFLVRDRVLVRLGPSPAWRGRYWIVDGIDGFDALVSELERRSASC